MGRHFSRRFAAFPVRPLRALLRRFARARQGATAVEFALVVGPFMATLMVIFEVSYLFLLGEALDSGLTTASRLILTGQAQDPSRTNKIIDQATFHQYAVCPSLPSLIDCTKVQTNVTQFTDFSSARPVSPISNGTLDTSSWGYTPCQHTTGVQTIMKVEAVYPVSALSAFFIYTTHTVNGGTTRVLYTSAVFRCEPF